VSEHHELFTELSSQQAAVMEGGLRLTIHSIECLKAGADDIFSGGDDMFVNTDGRFLTGNFNMRTGRNKQINRTISNFRNSMAIDLFDSDAVSQPDFLGGFTAQSTGGQIFSKRVSGSGSKYRIFYSAV
jgi:hypothetical protein